MAVCDLIIDFPGTPAAMIQTLKTKITAQGGTAEGDAASGNINVPILGSHISGTYIITGQQMHLAIDHKPFLISCNQIQSYLVGNL